MLFITGGTTNMGGIAIVTAGGTIDKEYAASGDNHGYNFTIGAPAVERILKRVSYQDATVIPVLQKDSLDMHDGDRAAIARAIFAATQQRIIVTHGTDTIKQTAERLSTIGGKVIVLTGAMTPERFRDSNADFNFGMAVAAVQILPPGVYIALNGAVVPWEQYVHR